MLARVWRRAFWILVALVVFVPPVTTIALQPIPDLVDGVLRSIPAPQPVEIRPRLFVAYGALVAACTLGILYLYRGRAFVVYWIVSWSMLAAAYTLNARGYADPWLGGAMIGLSQLLTVWSAALLFLSIDGFSKHETHKWNIPVQLGAISAVWFLAAPLVLPLSSVLYTGAAASAILKGWAAFRYAHLAKRTPIIGAFMMSAALGVMSVLDATSGVMTYRTEWTTLYTNTLLAFNIVTSVFIALGMHLLVFEDITDEIRRTNLALAVANEQIKKLAITDPLTGCYNRRFFDEIGRREMERHRRYGKPLTVMFVDLDQFKRLNDRYGHDMGDTVLRTVGVLLRRHVRQSDYVIRWGGDEFLLLLTCTVSEAADKAEEFKQAFAHERDAVGLPAGVGLSVGVAQVEDTAETLSNAIRLADAEMYRQKLTERAGT